jgi:hypothetical protein
MDNARAPWELSGAVRSVLVAVVLFVLFFARAGLAQKPPRDDSAVNDLLALTPAVMEVAVQEDLDRIRQDPKLASDGEAIDHLVKNANLARPSVFRTEAWSLAAEAYANRLDRPDEAVALWEKILADPTSDPVLARKAGRDLVNHRLARGDIEGARRAAGSDRAFLADVRRVERRGVARIVSIAAIVVLVLFAGVSALRGRRRVLPPVKRILRFALAYAVYVALAGALLASRYESGNARPFILLGAVLPPLFVLARAWSATGSSAPWARAGRALVSAAGAIGAAMLVLEHVNVSYLEGFGL